MTSIVWFRQDLRLSDNHAVLSASKLGTILPIYILDPRTFNIGSASKVYLYHSLKSLNQSLNNTLNFYIGDPKDILFQLIKKHNVEHVFWNRCYETWDDSIIQKKLSTLNINHAIFNGSYLWHPENIRKDDGSYYKVFGAFKRKVLLLRPEKTISKPENLIFMKDDGNETTIDNLGLLTHHPWQKKIKTYWTFGENAAQKKLDYFLHSCLPGYKNGRNYPGKNQTSRLSVNLHFGEISPNQVWYAVRNIEENLQDDVEPFLSELIWREFSCYLLFHFKGLPTENFQNRFNKFPWGYDEKLFDAWKTGSTGYALVDAGMRELWETGYMHNRVRMIVASFLVKNLMIHWHYGRDWFWDCLVDADLANNSMNWQWVSGCGVDAAPYFRIFNPITQAKKFDIDNDYIKKYVDLEKLPKPIVDLKTSRIKALSSYKSL